MKYWALLLALLPSIALAERLPGACHFRKHVVYPCNWDGPNGNWHKGDRYLELIRRGEIK